MTTPLMKSVSGIRGIVGETITPALVASVGSAFARYTGSGTVVIGRDTRPTGEAIERGLESALLLAGCSVINIGIVPTPTVEIMVEHLKADGGIVISASHNPVEWNAFKLIGKTGTFLTASEIEKFFELMELPHRGVPWDRVGTSTRDERSHEIHINRILSVIDADLVRKRKFRVVLDSVNGAGSAITLKLLETLGCETVPIHCSMTGIFPRGAEPVPENLSDLSRAVTANSADIGFAQDPDADRLAIVDETGRPIGEENTLALAVEHLLAKQVGRVVINLSTTRAVDDIAMKYGAPVARTRVGEINVVEEMMRHGARIGGEGNGGVISPEVHCGRDSLVGIAYVLEMMAERKLTASGLSDGLPRYAMKKGSIKLSGASIDSSLLRKLKKDFAGQKVSDIDGLRIEFINHPEFQGGWVHLRPSNTEPIFRIIVEAADPARADAMYLYFAGLLAT